MREIEGFSRNERRSGLKAGFSAILVSLGILVALMALS